MEEEKQPEEEISEEEEAKLAFANAQVVRQMRKNLSSDKMIKSAVKKGMNNFLSEICADVCRRLDKYPYATIDFRMFQEAIAPYKTLHKVEEEKKRIIIHLEAIKADANRLIRDVEETFITEDDSPT